MCCCWCYCYYHVLFFASHTLFVVTCQRNKYGNHSLLYSRALLVPSVPTAQRDSQQYHSRCHLLAISQHIHHPLIDNLHGERNIHCHPQCDRRECISHFSTAPQQRFQTRKIHLDLDAPTLFQHNTCSQENHTRHRVHSAGGVDVYDISRLGC